MLCILHISDAGISEQLLEERTEQQKKCAPKLRVKLMIFLPMFTHYLCKFNRIEGNEMNRD